MGKKQKIKEKGDANDDVPTSDDNKKEEKEQLPTISYFQLYRYATCLDRFLLAIALACAMVGGVGTPVMMIFFGDITNEMVMAANAFVNSETEQDRIQAQDQLMSAASNFAIYTAMLGAGTFVVVYISTMLFSFTCVRQISKIRSLYMQKVLNQDISWYDMNKTGDFSSRITEDLVKLEEGLGDKAGTFSFFVATFISGITIAFVYGWQLALICLAYLPLSSIAMGFVAFLTTKFSQQEMESYGAAGAIAEEVLSAIKTVFAFGGQQKEINRYKEHLITACKNNVKRALLNAISNGLMWFFMFGSYALSFYYGIGLVLDEWDLPPNERTYTVATLITVFFSILMATFTLGMSAPYIQIFGAARGAAAKVFSIIDSEPVINLSKGNGKRLDTFHGRIRFNDVHFSYPSRDDVKVIQGVNIKIDPGETVALVGSSGCGKSTCIQLMQRFYDTTSGNIQIDDVDMREFDLTWLRNQIGVVGQEPILFGMTIAENIKFGKYDATQKEIEAAARKSNAHNFISALPDGYDTLVGERGSQLSGGQKQRIAIARALVREPTILLLDEATSALDTNSEAQVQRAIDSVSKECTTIIVAHRLSTIRNAHKIIVFSAGKVVEEGTHDNLIALNGVYYNLVNAQISPVDLDGTLDTESTFKDDVNNEIEEIKKEAKEKDLADEEEMRKVASIPGLMRLNRPEWWQIAIGSIAALISGASFPVYAVVFGEVIGVFHLDDPERIREEGNRYSLYFLIIGIASGISTFFQWYMIGIAGEKLTKRVRALMFESVLRQEVGWYDKKENGVGAICAKLSSDAAAIQGAAGHPLIVLLNSISTLTIALVLALYFEWRLALVSLSIVPLIFIGTYFEEKINRQVTAGNVNAIESSTKIAIEAISNIRTVASLGSEETFYVLYTTELVPHYKKLKRGSFFRGFILGLARCLMFFSYGIAFYYGAVLIVYYDIDFTNVFKVSEALISAAWAVGNVMAFSPNFQKGIIAAGKMFKLVNRIPLIKDGLNSTYSGWKKSQVKYENVSFAYPTRSNTTVLDSLMLSVDEGKTVALVGPSGCGKSTIIQLLQRFYDPQAGYVKIDDVDLRNIKIMALRSHLGIVSQEPNLFDRTIADNIAYGDNNRIVTQAEITEAAKNANIHNFITSLPLGYETRLGEKGTQLSGGQKQRVAIARALIRNPQILLLDEATSALDTESEKVVQEALDQAKVGRTCITIAHRLSTIQDSDVIYVMNRGVIIEQGTHNELLNLKGLYHKLYMVQRGRH